MINPKEIKLLVFDLDGTIFQSDKATFEVMKKAFFDMNINTKITVEDIKKYLGEPPERFFTSLLGQEYSHLWKEVMAKYDLKISEFGSTFPNVRKTLNTLKSRGYKLALYSNCGLNYFNNVLLKTKIKHYFDYVECNGENNLTKNELVKKIMNEKFPGLKSAVIGDKIHDIEAAKENNALSIGVLYGYGKDEPKKADITIAQFSELLDIFK